MKIGFTGTQTGMTLDQKLKLFQELVVYLKTGVPLEIHHGGCVGADEEFHNTCLLLMDSRNIHVHYSNIKDKKAWLLGDCCFHPEKPPLDRNRDIVDACDMIIAAPKENYEVLRSGTWATIRYARSTKKSLYIIYPSDQIVDGRHKHYVTIL